MKKRKTLAIGLTFVIVAAAFATFAPLAFALPTANNFGVEDASGYKNTNVLVPVNITNVQNGPIISIIFNILYNNGVINVVDTYKGNLTSDWDNPSYNNFDWGTQVSIVYNENTIQNGSSGSVVVLNFTVIGETSRMNFTNIQLSDPEYNIGTAPAKNGTFTLLVYGLIKGQITDITGTEIEGVTVNLTSLDSGVVKTTTTNETGYYSFTTVEFGDYYINTSKLRFWGNSTLVTVESGETKTVNTILWKKGDLNDNDNSADAGDLAMMKDASVSKIIPDWKYDLNNNDIFADAGDLAMMKDASVGKIELL